MVSTSPVNEIHVWLSVHKPEKLLIIAPHDHELGARIKQSTAVAEVRWLEPGPEVVKSLGTETFDAALTLNALETMHKSDAGILIGRLRDVHTRRFLVLLRVGSEWEDQVSLWRRTDMIAYGLGLEAKYGLGARALHLYRFDINDYKRTPEWLNSRNWAHPELWDKYRW